jgi:hypothetical protein
MKLHRTSSIRNHASNFFLFDFRETFRFEIFFNAKNATQKTQSSQRDLARGKIARNTLFWYRKELRLYKKSL